MKNQINSLASVLLFGMLGASCTCNSKQAETEQKKEPVQAKEASTSATPEAKKIAAVHAECTDICKITDSLPCNSKCVENCQTLAEYPHCHDERQRFMECLAKQPVDNWECDPLRDVAGVKPEFCKLSKVAFTSCIAKNGG